MGNRSRYVVLTTAGALALAAARRRARLRRSMREAAIGVATPSGDGSLESERGIDEAHASGHRHLSLEEPAVVRSRWRHFPRGWSRAAYKVWEPFDPH